MSVKIDKGRSLGLVDLTPMLDVVFQLLLFFLVASKFADEERDMKVVLPQASEARPMVSKRQEIFVNVDRQGKYFIGGKELDLEQLDRQLVQLSADNPGRQTVIIRADKKCEWDHVAAVMNACNKADIRDYRVSTIQGKKP